MANGDPQKPTLRSTLMGMNPKVALAFFNQVIAAGLVIYLIDTLTSTTKTLDAGTIALFASMVTTFILIAKSSSDYQFTSSAGSDKKDETQAKVSSALAEKVPAPAAPAPVSTAPVPPWWTRLRDDEKNAITAAVASDPRVASIVTAMQVGAATTDDLTYLVTKGLLTQDRATAVSAA